MSKPKLIKRHGCWWCYGGWALGVGETPLLAYYRYKSNRFLLELNGI